MNIKQVKQSVDLLLQSPQVVTPFIKGKPGIGKSEIIAQIAESRDIGFIDLRLSQLESADIRGIPTPDLNMSSSRWLPPETIPFEAFQDCTIPGDPKKRKFSDGGILFLDEFNRARFDVIQAAFQLVLDRRVGLHKLLDNWFIVCSGNLGEADGTDVTELSDSALNNRFAHFYIEDNGLYDCWVEWAEGPGKVHADVVGFIKTKPSALYNTPKESDEVYATPRTWTKFSKILQQNPDTKPEAIVSMVGFQLVGTSMVGFLDYLKEKSQIKAQDIINKYTDIKTSIESLDRARKYSLSNELISYLKDHTSLDKKRLNNVHCFITEQLEDDHMIAIFKELVNIEVDYKDGKKKYAVEFIDVYLDTYPEMSDKITKCFYNED